MPIYEFQCQACGAEIEVLQKISDPHITDCEACGKAKMRKKVTAAAFRLSGAGWYETDFKESDKKKNLTEANDAKPSSSKESDSKSNSDKSASDSSKKTVKDKSSSTTKTTTKSTD